MKACKVLQTLQMLKGLPYAVFFDVCEPVLPDNKQTKKMTNMGLDSSQNEAFRLSFLEKEKKKSNVSHR